MNRLHLACDSVAAVGVIGLVITLLRARTMRPPVQGLSDIRFVLGIVVAGLVFVWPTLFLRQTRPTFREALIDAFIITVSFVLVSAIVYCKEGVNSERAVLPFPHLRSPSVLVVAAVSVFLLWASNMCRFLAPFL